MTSRIVEKIRNSSPLVHCITNHVTANDCANALLAVGARPIMAEHPREAAEVTARAGALALNLGGISDEKMEAMRNALLSAKRHGVPVTLDLVGAAASNVRLEFARELIALAVPSVIKGNASEIMALCGISDSACGVDSGSAGLDRDRVRALSADTGAVVLASGEVDFVTDSVRCAGIANGCEMMRCVTGMGCMLNALCGAFLACCDDAYTAAVTAAAAFGAAGERVSAVGSGSFRVGFMDELYNLNDELINTKAEIIYGL